MGERKFIPLTEVESEKVNFDINFPDYVPVAQIGVNVRGVERLCKVAGIRFLKVAGADDAIATGVPLIGGYDSGGSAYAVRGGVQSATPEFTYAPNSPRHRGDHRYTWINAGININMNQVGSVVADSKDGIKSAAEWSNHLNKALKEGISGIGTDFLVFGLNRWDSVAAGWKYGLMVLFNTGNLPIISDIVQPITGFRGYSDPKQLLGGIMLTNVVWNTFDQVEQYRKRENRIEFGRRFSFFYGPEFDRAVLLQLAARVTTLARPLS